MRVTLLIILLVFTFQPNRDAHAASFDCARATTEIERLICSDDQLSASDSELAGAYEEFAKKLKDPKFARELQRKWLTDIRGRCTSADCLTEVYRKRISQLTTGTPPDIAYMLNQCEYQVNPAIGFCIGGRVALEEQHLNGLIDVLISTKQLTEPRETSFRSKEAAWRKDIECYCEQEACGDGPTCIGTGVGAQISGCELLQLQRREKELAAIFEGAPLDSGGQSPTTCAQIAQERDERKIRFALHLAVRSGDVEAVRKHLAAGKDPNDEDDQEQSPLSIAVMSRNAAISELLLKSGAKVNYAMNDAAYQGDIELVKLFLKYGGSVDGDKRPPLLDASYGGKTEVVRFLLNNGADVNGKGSSVPPIYAAAQSGHFEIVRILADSGADINRQDRKTGRTALMGAALHAKNDSQLEIVRMLVEKGARPQIRDQNGKTALDYAKQYGNAEIIKLFNN